MRTSDRNVGTVAALLVAVCCLAAAAFAAPAGAQTTAFPQTDDQPEPDNTITRIDLADDGSATWEITFRTRLANDTDVAEYERFQERFRSNTSRYLDPFTERMTGVVAAANESSDRTMRAAEFEAETGIQEVPRRWGTVSFRFTWTGFAAVDGDAVVAGDVFAGGFFIGEDDALAIRAPDGYAVADASPEPDGSGDGVVEWQGREDFDDGQPRVRAVPAATGGDGSGDASENGITDDVGGDIGLVAVGALLLAAALGLVAAAGRSDRLGLGDDDDLAASVGSGGDGGDSGERSVSAGSDAAASGTAGGAATASANGGAGDVDPDLLTDEDRVRRTLRDRGGRMKQSEIVDELGWSKSKTSRVLSRMADEGTVEKLRIGRENVIDLVDED